MALSKLDQLCRQLKGFLDAGFIRFSKTPFGALVFFQRKHNGFLWLCINYWALNKLTVKNKHLITLIVDLFDQLEGALWLSKFDLRLGYYQVWIAEGDEQKTASITRYESFEFLVMPFGLTNVSAIFCIQMNKVLKLFLDKFVVVYLDDIVVYSWTLEEHMIHLQQIFQVFKENELYIKKKYVFT